jgi:glycosyltransferase involved in cell wall biosynthesis
MRKHLVIVFTGLDIGGIERKIVDLANYYQSTTKVTLILRHQKGQLLKEIDPKVTIIESSLYPPILTLKLLCLRPSLILTYGNYCSVCTILSAPFSKIIISEDSSIDKQIELDTYPRLRKLLIKLTYPLATKIIALTSAGQQKINSLINTSNAVIMPNWLPLPFKSTKTLNKKIDILFLGRFVPQKNPLCFLRICKKFGDKKITMVGSGVLDTKIKKYIKKHDLNVNLLPATTNPSQYYQQSKILLVTSVHEGFPLTILEALANNCLPIVPTLPELTDFFDYQSAKIMYRTNPVKQIKMLLTETIIMAKITRYYRLRTISQQITNFNKTIKFLNQYL